MTSNSLLNDYQAVDAIGLAEWVARGDVSADELLDAAIARCEAVDPKIHALVCRHDAEARAQIAAGLPDGPFRGVPFLIKDLALQLNGTRTTNGCRYFKDHIASFDSELVSRYKQAGLVIFGKTASPEFGLTTTTESSLHGATRNPWNLNHTSGGSSGGASAAVAAGILPMANASDGGGSIRIPASCCGLVGMKPTRGRMPFGPAVGEGWAGMSTIHAVSRSVRDNAALLDATDAPDPGAPYWAPPIARPYLDEVSADPGRLRIAFQTEAFNGSEVHPDCIAAIHDAVQLCIDLGHEVKEAPLAVNSAELGPATQTIISANLRTDLLAREEIVGRPPGEDDLEPFTHLMLRATEGRTASEYVAATRTIHQIGRQVEAHFADHDILLTTTLGTPPLEIGALSLANPDVGVMVGNLMKTTAFTQVFNVSGHPAISLPLFWNDAGLPIGIQLAGRFGDEATLFRLAGQLESARPWFERRPTF